jgi:hypothetical protein
MMTTFHCRRGVFGTRRPFLKADDGDARLNRHPTDADVYVFISINTNTTTPILKQYSIAGGGVFGTRRPFLKADDGDARLSRHPTDADVYVFISINTNTTTPILKQLPSNSLKLFTKVFTNLRRSYHYLLLLRPVFPPFLSSHQ